jgi:hypothetical protein
MMEEDIPDSTTKYDGMWQISHSIIFVVTS